MKFREFEFWHPRVFEAPYYLYLLWRCLRRGLSPKSLAKANYALDHGEIGIGSKMHTQLAFDQQFFLPAALIAADSAVTEKRLQLQNFGQQHGFPLILKPDIGSVGKGVIKVDSDLDAAAAVDNLPGPYLVQKFTDLPCEFGVFYTRSKGVGKVTGINQKHFPTVVGDGVQSLGALAVAHPRYTAHWRLFLKYLDTEQVLVNQQAVCLSFIGSHTMGCEFTEDTHLLTPDISEAMACICETQAGFNFGRLDVKAADEAAFQRGDFVVIEVNGVASLPTNMFDPANSIWRAYRVFLNHGYQLVEIAHEHRHQPMMLASWREIVRRVRGNAQLLNQQHQSAMS